MKITIYELLGLVKDGKQPNKIKYKGQEYTFFKDNEVTDYSFKDDNEIYGWLSTSIGNEYISDIFIDEVEIIDEKMCKINLYYSVPNKIHNTKVLRETLEKIIENQRTQEDKINKLIDEINNLKEKD